MSFGYIQGDEAAALDYFEQRLQKAVSKEERQQLTELVERLKEELAKSEQGRNAANRLTAAGLSNSARLTALDLKSF